jgi:hypothetical protein
MLRTLAKLAFLSLLVVTGAAGLMLHRRDTTAVQLDEAKQRNEQLKQVVRRLEAERRVADVIVTEQKKVDGALKTTLLFVEYARDGSTLPARRFTVDGNVAHIDAMVVKFERDFVQNNDPLRGHSLALFTRLYGESQAPEKGFPIDPPGSIPDAYRGPDPEVTDFERDLWADFWKLADDEAYRKTKGVRIAQGEGVWVPFKPDTLYTVALEAGGGLNITSSPLKGIYREALKHTTEPRAVSPAL